MVPKVPFKGLVPGSSFLLRYQRGQRVCIMSIPTITFVTGNCDKLREVSQILMSKTNVNPKFKIISKKLDLPELQGEPEDIARQKCELATKYIGGPTVSLETN